MKPHQKPHLKVIPLGGLEQIGMNMTAFEYRDTIIVVDCGLAFPEDDMLGIDMCIPDITYLVENKEKVKGFFITHGHEDHIGAIPYVIREVNVPIYATKLTMGLIDHKLEEKGLLEKTKRKVVKFGQTIQTGPFKVEFIKTNHSIQDAAALAIFTPVGVLVHTGDFKVDYTPVFGDAIDLQRFAELGKHGVLGLMCDSTNAERPGFTESESTVGVTFNDIFAENRDFRIIIATFASNVDRVQQIINTAYKYGRKVVVEGRSMVTIIDIAQKMKKTEIVNMFNNRNEKFYNRLKVQNTKYFEDAYKAYKANKNDPELADYAKAWVGKNEEFANLTWEYIEYLTTVEHTGYGKGLDRIYDGLVFDKYPWEHIGIGDRKSYRAYDLTMIAKCLFMISLYSAHGGLNDVEKEGLYNSYKGYKPQLKAFSEFKISDPDKFRVCQIKGAHFIMHKEIQTYNYVGNNNECPHPNIYGANGIYRPKWHEAGSIKIENPEELKSKLIHTSEMDAVSKFYDPDTGRMSWVDMLVKGKDNAGGAVISNKQIGNDPSLLLYNPGGRNGAAIVEHRDELALVFYSITAYGGAAEWLAIGPVDNNRWVRVDPERRYYAAIVEKHY